MNAMEILLAAVIVTSCSGLSICQHYVKCNDSKVYQVILSCPGLEGNERNLKALRVNQSMVFMSSLLLAPPTSENLIMRLRVWRPAVGVEKDKIMHKRTQKHLLLI